MRDRQEIDVGYLVHQWEQEKERHSTLDPATMLFPFLERLAESDIQKYDAALRSKGYPEICERSVEDVKALAETYHSIDRCIQEGFFSAP